MPRVPELLVALGPAAREDALLHGVATGEVRVDLADLEDLAVEKDAG
jgi:hypothetical protein